MKGKLANAHPKEESEKLNSALSVDLLLLAITNQCTLALFEKYIYW